MKPGILTTEFWLVVAVNVLTQAGALDVPDRYKWAVTLATITGYALSRGLAKANAPLGEPALADPELDDPRAGVDEPIEPPAGPPWQSQAAAAGWAPPTTAAPATPSFPSGV